MDYQSMGFKCGLEIHQRLDTRKLFCGCYCDPNKPAAETRPHKIIRKLKAVVGELGEVDRAAAFEAGKGKIFSYSFDASTSCDVELDEEPPHPMNKDALHLGFTISKMLGAQIVDEIFVMRKTVIDGSAVSGFQRTALFALNGKIQTGKGEVSIPTIALEEESSGILEKSDGNEISYRLDRFGIPLIEIATAPTLQDGLHAMETAEKIGQLLRSTGKVQRGLGTIRQDLNISIARGARVEIKGAQDLKLIPLLIDNEVQRQINLLKLRERLQEKHILLGREHFSPQEAGEIFENTGCKLIETAMKRKEKIFAMKLAGFAGIFKTEIMPALTFGKEVASYVRHFSRAKGILHSDEDLAGKYGISNQELQKLERKLNAKKDDLLIICLGSGETCRTALAVAFERAAQLQKGVPEETRRAEGEISIFMRPLPGSARLYPETDVPPIKVTQEMLLAAVEDLPELPEEKLKKYLKWGLNQQVAEKMLRSQDWGRFESLASSIKTEPQFIAILLLETLTSMKRDGAPVEKLADSDISEALKLQSSSLLTKSAVQELLKLKCLSPEKALADLVEENSLKKLGDRELASLINKAEGSAEKKFAELIKRYRLQIDAAKLRQLLEQQK